MPRFVPRERKHKKLARNRTISNTTSNSNAEVVVPESKSERDARRDALREELRAQQPESKSSSKKRKRLDKYIETKLRKEDNAELLRKLADQKVDTSLLRSSKTLGRVKESKRERLSRAISERNAGIGDDSILLEPRREANHSESQSTMQDDAKARGSVHGAALKDVTPSSGFGSGLKRPLEADESGQPVIKKRKRRKGKAKVDAILQMNGSVATNGAEDISPDDQGNEAFSSNSSNDGEDGEEWNGFSSEDEERFFARGDESASSGSDEDSDEEQEASDSGSSASSSSEEDRKPRVSAFKSWADSLKNKAVGFTPSSAPTNDDAARANFKPRMPSPDPLMESTLTSSTAESCSKPAVAVAVPRAEEVQTSRLELPVVRDEQRIMESINNHPVVVICGATGSGKTTQIPQMLFENGYAGDPTSSDRSNSPATSELRGPAMIGVTQPRRVAATSVASRVRYELGAEFGKTVSHQVRYDTNVGKNTRIKFMTDGILLKEIQNDFALSKYSVIVLDEAHERSVNTDVLIGMLARIVPLRSQLAKEDPKNYSPLKLIIMSATLSQGVDSFLGNEKLWKPFGGRPPVIDVEGRQYPVTVHFSKKTRRDYIGEVVEKVARGHKKLPPGGMLVFLTGQDEIQTVIRKLRENMQGAKAKSEDDENGSDRDGVAANRKDFLEQEDEYSDDDHSEAEIKLDEADAEFEIPDDMTSATSKTPLKPHFLPLYAALPQNEQGKVFQPPPQGTRMIVLATNVAETSLTIPGIRYVVDSGRAKEKRYNTSTGVQTFEVDLISKASAEQRKGRAGRTGPGHVWRLYSSNIYEQFFAAETVPEVLRSSLESVVLQLKGMDVANVPNFPFPTPPDPEALEKAETLLRNLGAINKNGVTVVGKEIMRCPVNPRLAKILVLAQQNGVLVYAIAVVAGLAVGNLFIPEPQRLAAAVNGDGSSEEDDDGNKVQRNQAESAAKERQEEQRKAYGEAQAGLSSWDEKSDAAKILAAVGLYSDHESNYTSPRELCGKYFLRQKAMAEVQLLRKQLHSIFQGQNGEKRDDLPFTKSMPKPQEEDISRLNQLVAAGFVDQVAIRSDLLPSSANGSGFGRKARIATEVAYRTLVPSASFGDVSRTPEPLHREIMRSVFVHPSSILARLTVKEMPECIVYSHLSRAAPSPIENDNGKIKRVRFHPLAPVSQHALATVAEGTPLLRFGKPIDKIEDLPVDARGAKRRQCWVGVGLKAEGGEFEFPLGSWKVVQKRGGRDWEVEKVLAR